MVYPLYRVIDIIQEHNMSWTKQDIAFKKIKHKQATDALGKLEQNELGASTMHLHMAEIWLDPIPVAPDGTEGYIEYYEDFELTQDVSVPGAKCWYAESGGARLTDWIPDKYDSQSYSPYNIILKDDSGNLIPYGNEGHNWTFDYETGILTFQSDPNASLYNSDNLTITGYRYIGRKGMYHDFIKKSCKAATTDATIDGDWSWASTDGGTITVANTTTLTIDGIDLSIRANPDNRPLYNAIADRILVKDYTGSDEYKNGIYEVANYAADTWTLIRVADYNSGNIYPDSMVFIQNGTSNEGTVWIMSNRSFTTLNALDATGKITFSRGVGLSYGTPNTIPKFGNDGSTIEDSIMQEVNGDYIEINGGLAATTKSFVIPHPTKPNAKLMYGCLEGPEHGVYYRGIIEGKGCTSVMLPEYWSKLCNNYTVSLASYNHHIVLKSKCNDRFVICPSGLFGRWKKFKVEYIIVGDRIDAPLVTEIEV